MKRFKYARLWLLLALGLIIVVYYSFLERDVKIGEWSVKKAPIANYLLNKSESIDEEEIEKDTIPSNIMEEDVKVKVDSLPQTIFIFGDSMTFNLALRLAQYARQNGHTIHTVNWDSSNTKIWAESDTLRYFMDLYHPTQVFISLGSNEMYFKNPESRSSYVSKILEVIDTVPYVWIGPPSWKEESKIDEMLEKMCKKGSFFRSTGMKFERKKDKIHPTRKSSALWVDSIMRWIPSSSHPYLVEAPPDSIKKSNPNVVFLKALNK